MPPLPGQVAWLLLLALPIACIAWTVTHEELLREPRDFFTQQSESRPRWYQRKFFYILTCDYCFSHYVAIALLALTGYRLLLPDWRGVLIGGFGLVWIANIYMSIFGRLRQVIKSEKVDIAIKEKVLDES